MSPLVTNSLSWDRAVHGTLKPGMPLEPQTEAFTWGFLDFPIFPDFPGVQRSPGKKKTKLGAHQMAPPGLPGMKNPS